jgi:hypothetical protein
LAAIVLLILAVLTKQTAAVFLVAAVLAAALTGQWRRGVLIVAAAGAGLLVIVAAVNLVFEPHFARSLVGERVTPWRFATWRFMLGRIERTSPQLLVLPAVGLWLWLWPEDKSRHREVRPAVLAALLLAAALGLSAKVGADTNYYLNLRVAVALAVGALWHAVHADTTQRSFRRSAALAAAGLLAIVVMFPSSWTALGYAEMSLIEAAFYDTPDGQLLLRANRDVMAMARDPRIHVLTDSAMIDLYQGERAIIGDPWLFCTLVEAQRLRPTEMARRIDSQYYDVFISGHDLDAPDYSRHDSRLPAGLFERVRANYVRHSSPPGFAIYTPRGKRDVVLSPGSPAPGHASGAPSRSSAVTGREHGPGQHWTQ